MEMITGKRMKPALGLWLFACLCCALSSEASTINVTTLSDNGPGTLREAIGAAQAGDTINFGLLGVILLTSGELVIDKSITIDGPGARYLTITRASNATMFRIFHITAGKVTISGLTMGNGEEQSVGGGVWVDYAGGATFNDCTITNNSAEAGGGMWVSDTDVTLNRCTVSLNGATVSGGGIGLSVNGSTQRTLKLNNCTIAENTVNVSPSATAGGGGGLVVGASAQNGVIELHSCTVADNTATTGAASGGGGGIWNDTGSPGVVSLDNTIVAGNKTDQKGPDVLGSFQSNGYNLIRIKTGGSGFSTANHDQLGDATTPVDAFLGPLQDNGGATDTKAPGPNSPAVDQGKASPGLSRDERRRSRPYDNPDKDNVAGGDGSDIGAVELMPRQTFTVTNESDHDNGSLRDCLTLAAPGDSIVFASGVADIKFTDEPLILAKNMTITGPGPKALTIEAGAFIEVGKAKVSIGGLTIVNYSSQMTVSDGGTATVQNCSITGGVGGIVVFSGATLNLRQSTIAKNSGTAARGLGNLGTASLTNCTIADNQSNGTNAEAVGGGIYNNGTLTLLNCTIADNRTTGSAAIGGGIINAQNGVLHIGNTIVAGNTADEADPDVSGAFQTDGYNLIGMVGSATGFDATNHDIIGTVDAPENALLGDLTDNGGDTETLALGQGSPAINTGNDATAPSTDQRRFARVGVSDIGAFELSTVIAPTPTPTPIPDGSPGATPTPTATATPVAQLLNISTRMEILTGSNVLIGGFIIVGEDQKKVLVRGKGPSLPLSGTLADPTLELHDANSAIATNDNWRDTQEADIEATTIPPTDDLEPAIVQTLNPGGYTAILAGNGQTTGIGQVELYDLSPGADAKLANISTRGYVDTGDNVMIGGVILGPDGSGAARMLVRAIGPSLSAQGVDGALQDPTLELHDGNGNLIATNDNWKDSQQADIEATPIPPTNDLESAIVQTLAPGGYTAIVRGNQNTTGVALVELYQIGQ